MKRTLSLLFLALTLALAAQEKPAAPPAYMEPWRPHAIPVGNERDGFHDTVQGRRTATAIDAPDGEVAAMPYLTLVPGQKRLILMYARGLTLRCKFMESSDEGETWSAPRTPGDVDWLGTCYALVACGNGIIFMDNNAYRSTDNGKTWKWLGMDDDPRFGHFICGWDPPFVFPDSDGKHIIDTGYDNRNFEYPEAKSTPLWRESFDAGETWTEWRAFAEFPGCTEVHIIDNGRGELLAAMRATTLMAPTDDQSDRLQYSLSKDGGKTWAPPKVIAGNGRHHPSMARLPDGRIVMTYVVRTGYPDEDGKYAYGIEAVVSNDGGHTWDFAHRYLIAHWTHDCIVTDEEGRRVQVQKFYAAPQSTSTVYLPESKTLLTAYGTAQEIALMKGAHVYPRQVALVRWMPLEKYSEEKDPPAPPLPAEQALAELRANPYWSVNYMAMTGIPDAGWIHRFPEIAVSMVKDAQGQSWLRMDNRGTGGTYSMRGIDHLERITGPVGLRMRLNIMPDEDASRPERFTFLANVGTGHDKYAIVLFFGADGYVSGTLGKVQVCEKLGQPFLLEIHVDPKARKGRMWVDGKLVSEADVAPGSIAPETPATLWFGRGTPRVGGFTELAELQFGEIRQAVGAE